MSQYPLGKKVTILLFFLLIYFATSAQPCLSGWSYRMPVTVDNSANAFTLTDHQVMVSLNTAQLVLDGKMKVDGGDLRVTNDAGNLISFWIETGTINTSTTRLWIKVPQVAANTIANIYVFYGNPSASTVSNGTTTFELFDDFTGTSVDPAKWSVCNSGSLSVSGGKITLSANPNTVALSSVPLSSPVKVAMKVSDFDFTNNGFTFLGLINNGTHNGYVGGIKHVSPGTRISHRKVTSPGTCYTFDTESLGPSTSPVNTWEFSWPASSQQKSSIGIETYSTIDAAFIPGSSHRVIFGNADMNGNISVDYLYARKYVSNEPVITNGTEVNINIPAISASSNSPLCEGGDLVLSVTEVPGATYIWKDAGNNTIGSDREITLTGIAASASGTYNVSVSIPSGCASKNATTVVKIDPATNPGTASLDNTVCYGNNTGTINLAGHTGDIVRWETSQTGAEPWASINTTTTSLSYKNLISTAYYRAVVKSGVCNEEHSNTIAITVDPLTVKGDVTGTDQVCAGENSGALRVVGKTGDVIRWESSVNNGTTWVSITNNTANLNFENIDNDTQYRAVVKSGVCPQAFTEPFVVNVNPLPDPDFQAEAKCLGEFISFVNHSTVDEGSIVSYLWEFRDGNSSTSREPQHTFLTHGEKNVLLTTTTKAGCSASIEKTVTVFAKPVLNFTASQTCDGFPTDFTNLSTISAGAIESFTWDFGDGTGSNQEHPQKQYFNSGTYLAILSAVSDNGCTATFSKNVTVDGLPVANFTAQDVCLGEAMIFRNASFFNAGPLTYEWDFGDGGHDVASSPAHKYDAPGIFQVKLIATTNKGCQDSITRSVQVRTLIGASAGNDVSISKGSGTMLSASGGVTYLWSPSSSLSDPSIANPVATPAETTEYTVQVTDALGCTATDAVVVSVIDDFKLEAMNVLTPNGDGVNDTWKIKNIENYGSAMVYVYDRNGVEVFSAREYANDWNGSAGADLLPDGTYYYLVKFSDSDVAYTGSLTILRNDK